MSYKGVNRFISQYKEPFDEYNVSLKVAKKRLTEQNISTGSRAGKELLDAERLVVLAEWKEKALKGSIAHEFIQAREMEKYPNSVLGSYKKIEEGEELSELEINKVERDCHYYEKQVVDNDNKLVGYIDHLYVDKKGYIYIEDYKTYGKLTKGYSYEKNGMRFSNYLFPPVSHLIDCKFTEANLQMSFYMYMLWKTNKRFKPKELTLTHVILNDKGERTGEEISYSAPYLLNEVKAMLKDSKKKDGNIISS